MAALYVSKAERLALSGNFNEAEVIGHFKHVIEYTIQCVPEVQITKDQFETISEIDYSCTGFITENSKDQVIEPPDMYLAHSNPWDDTDESEAFHYLVADILKKLVLRNWFRHRTKLWLK